MDDRHRLGNLIIQYHNYRQNELNNQDLIVSGVFDDNVNPQNPARISFSNYGSISRQYHINMLSVRMDYFFPAQSVHLYDHLWNHFNSPPNHLFGNGISGNGLKNLTTRSIKLTLNQGANNYHQHGQEIAQLSVNNMITLLQQLEPNLPDDHRIALNFPHQ